ncbi:MAG: heat-inducible transcription repressor HrcA [Ruminococcaceae bacterium]|nr:heat-inducible transcription repressor HrcA [Oscillospiraceae bacterium]
MYGKGDGLSERKKKILRAIIDAHIDRGEPVGSKYLTQNNDIAFSSATIRNEMAELEELGYLEQPHTSAGRIPSELGYRFYVDSLMERYRLTRDELDQLDALKSSKEAELDRIIEQAGRLFSSITNYTAITVKPRPVQVVITNFNTVFVDSHSFVLVMVSNTGVANTKLIKTSVEINVNVTDRLSQLLNTHVAGIKIDELSYSSILEIQKCMFGYEAIVEPIIKCIYDTVKEIDRGDVKVEQVNRLLEFPEYSNRSELRSLIGMLEQKEDIIDLISNSQKDIINILIGKENSVDIMSNSTIIFKTITANDKVVGAIGVIGPRRMDYSKVVTTLDLLSENIRGMFDINQNSLPDGKNGGENG